MSVGGHFCGHQLKIPIPLWKKMTSNKIQLEQQVQIRKPQNKDQQGQNPPKHTDINLFLNKVHQKVVNDSFFNSHQESQIVQQIDVDWDLQSVQHLGVKCKNNTTENTAMRQCQLCKQYYEQQLCNRKLLLFLSKVKNIQEFIEIMEYINPNISKQIQYIKIGYDKLTQESKLLRYNDKKNSIKIKLYNNQINLLQNNTQKIMKDLNSLRKQISQKFIQKQKLKEILQKKQAINFQHDMNSLKQNRSHGQAKQKVSQIYLQQICQKCSNITDSLNQSFQTYKQIIKISQYQSSVLQASTKLLQHEQVLKSERAKRREKVVKNKFIDKNTPLSSRVTTMTKHSIETDKSNTKKSSHRNIKPKSNQQNANKNLHSCKLTYEGNNSSKQTSKPKCNINFGNQSLNTGRSNNLNNQLIISEILSRNINLVLPMPSNHQEVKQTGQINADTVVNENGVVIATNESKNSISGSKCLIHSDLNASESITIAEQVYKNRCKQKL